MTELKQVVFTVRGLPAPQGSKKAVGVRKSKTGRMVTTLAESSKKVKPWRALVDTAAQIERMKHGQFDGPLWVQMTFTMPRPKRVPKKYGNLPITRPDISKLARSTEDALTTSGLIADDGRITDLHLRKRLVGSRGDDVLASPGCVIVIIERKPA